MKITLLSPVRQRPEGIKAFWNSIVASTMVPEKLSVIFGVDDDDHVAFTTARELPQDRCRCLVVQFDNRTAGPGTTRRWNILMQHAPQDTDIFGPGSNDSVFQTLSWDNMVRDAFKQWPDRIGLVHGNDCNNGEKLATHFFLSKQWCETLGYYVPENYHHYYVDNFVQEVATRLGRLRYIPNMITEHAHSFVGKRRQDDVDTRNMNANWAHDMGVWKSQAGRVQVDEAVEKLRKAMR